MANPRVLCPNCGFDVSKQIDPQYCAKCGTKVGEHPSKSRPNIEEVFAKQEEQYKKNASTTPDLIVSLSKPMMVLNMLWLASLAFFFAMQFAVAKLLTISWAYIVGAILTALIWLTLGSRLLKSRLELHGTKLIATAMKRIVYLDHLARARFQGRRTLILEDEYGNKLSITLLGFFETGTMASLIKKVRPYILADSVDKDDKVLKKLDVFVERYGKSAP